MANSKNKRPRLMLNQMQKAEAEKAAAECIKKLIEQKGGEWKRQIMLDDRRLLCAIVFMVLHDKFGFGEKRLKRFDDEVSEVMRSIVGGYLTAKDIYDWFEDELGMKFDLAAASPSANIIKNKNQKR